MGKREAMNEDAYGQGFRAGHLQGWQDAVAKYGLTLAGTASPVANSNESEMMRGPEQGRVTAMPSRSVEWGTEGSAVIPTEPLLASDSVSRVPGNPENNHPSPLNRAPYYFPTQQPYAQPVALSPEELGRRKAKRDNQNINITLYVASLLFVAAAGLFVGIGLPPAVSFVAMCGMTAAFYGAGLSLHARVPRLRPASIAFTGTGLALIPVCGLSMYGFILPYGPAAWFVTSILGLVAYSYAALRLSSRVLVYLSLAFILSTAMAAAPTLGAAVVWNYMAVIATAAGLTFATRLAPAWMPGIFLEPARIVHPLVIPAVCAAATVVPGLGGYGYTAVLGLSGIYYSALIFASGSRAALWDLYGARLTLTLALGTLVGSISGSGQSGLVAVVGLVSVQSACLAAAQDYLARHFPLAYKHRKGCALRRGAWRADSFVTFGVAATLSLVLLVLTALDRGGVGAMSFSGRGTPGWQPTVAVVILSAAGMYLGWKNRGVAEYAALVPFVFAVVMNQALLPWASVLLLGAWTCWWAFRCSREQVGRSLLVLFARIAVTVFVPLLVYQSDPTSPDCLRRVLLAFVLVLAVQLVVTGVLEVRLVETVAPRVTALISYAVGLGAVLSMAGFGAENSGPLLIAVLFLLAGVLMSGWLLLRNASRSWDDAAVAWSVPLTGLVMALLARSQISAYAEMVVFVMLVGYFLASAHKMPSLRHWYWLSARAAGTAALLEWLAESERRGSIDDVGNALSPIMVAAVVVLVAQMAFPLICAYRGRAASWVVADVAGSLVLTSILALAMVLTHQDYIYGYSVLSRTPDFSLVSALAQGAVLGFVALASVTAGWVLCGRPGAWPLAPGVALVVFGAGSGNIFSCEFALLIFAAFSSVMTAKASEPIAKGSYFIAARILFAALAVLVTYHYTSSYVVVSVSMALVLGAQHCVRWLLRHRLESVPFQQGAVWITLAGQCLLPVSGVISLHGGVAAAERGTRWMILLELVLLLVSALFADRFFRARGANHFAVGAVLAAVVVLGPLGTSSTNGNHFLAGQVISSVGVVLSMVLITAFACGAGIRFSSSPSGANRSLWLSASGGGLLVAGLTLAIVPAGSFTLLLSLTVLAAAAVLLISSHTEDLAFLYPPAAIAGVVGFNVLSHALMAGAVEQGRLAGPWAAYLPLLTGSLVAGLILYGAFLAQFAPVLLASERSVSIRNGTLAWGGVGALALPGVLGLWTSETVWTAAVVLLLTIAAVVHAVPRRAKRLTLEMGTVFAVAAVQQASIHSIGLWGSNGRWLGGEIFSEPFWVLQWFVVTGAGLAALRYWHNSPHLGRAYLAGSAGLLTLSSAIALFSAGDGQQLVILVGLVLVLIAGLLVRDRLFVWWGALGVTLCIVWALRGYTFLLLIVIAVGLVSFALWRLIRSRPETAEKDSMPQPPGKGLAPSAAARWPGHQQPGTQLPPGPERSPASGSRPDGADTLEPTERGASWDG